VLPFISIVIPVRNDAARLQLCLQAIAANDYPRNRYEVLVHDNGSIDDSVAVARRACCRVYIEPNVRVGELRNRAAGRAKGNILAFIDADHQIAEGWLRAAAESLQAPKVAAVGAPYRAPVPATWVQRALDAQREPPVGQRVDWLPSGNLAVWRNAFLQVDGFDASLETCEDVDFCRRLRGAGFQIVADGRMHSRHLGEPATLGQLFKAELWRGRDNLRVSFRRPTTWRTLVSAAIPVLHLLVPSAAFVALMAYGGQVAALAAAAMLLPVALSTARAIRMTRGAGRRRAPAIDSWLISLTYDAARALALVSRVAHRHALGGGRS
jgi:glycosyltransferase involved in cell wall biosynthesis